MGSFQIRPGLLSSCNVNTFLNWTSDCDPSLKRHSTRFQAHLIACWRDSQTIKTKRTGCLKNLSSSQKSVSLNPFTSVKKKQHHSIKCHHENISPASFFLFTSFHFLPRQLRCIRSPPDSARCDHAVSVNWSHQDLESHFKINGYSQEME